ncbi:glycosyltransferase family 2 protein [Actinosynnema sp. NPDC023658]|uniref:glycosyltransferase family 2 protein n=1 Tax=Actinosynnema sp. NPDC023658 TaxID=3155465 RepID=UPI00340B7206
MPRAEDSPARGDRITLLVPAYNEEEVIPVLVDRLESVADSLPAYDFTFLFVDDGSDDRTLELIKDRAAADPRIAWVSLSRNFGKESAMIAGLDHVDADATVILDADLQDPPELIGRMIAAWEEGYEDVYARRRSRAGESWLKKFTSHAFYTVLQHTTRVRLQMDTGDFRLLDRRCVSALRRFRETERYTKGMFSLIGFRKKEVLYDRAERAAGRTKWSYGGLLGLAIDGITSFTTSPLRVATVLGLLMAGTSFVHLIYIVSMSVFTDRRFHETTQMTATLICIGGVQLFCLGIIGEYVGRIYKESKRRPLYFVEERHLRERRP